MNRAHITVELANEGSLEHTEARPTGMEQEVRTLRDLEMVLIGGGGDGVPIW